MQKYAGSIGGGAYIGKEIVGEITYIVNGKVINEKTPMTPIDIPSHAIDIQQYGTNGIMWLEPPNTNPRIIADCSNRSINGVVPYAEYFNNNKN